MCFFPFFLFPLTAARVACTMYRLTRRCAIQREIHQLMKQIDNRLWDLQVSAAGKGFFTKEEAEEKRILQAEFAKLEAELAELGLERFVRR